VREARRRRRPGHLRPSRLPRRRAWGPGPADPWPGAVPSPAPACGSRRAWPVCRCQAGVTVGSAAAALPGGGRARSACNRHPAKPARFPTGLTYSDMGIRWLPWHEQRRRRTRSTR
jgi:hypothetical protein